MNQPMQNLQPAVQELTIADLFGIWEQLPADAVIVDIRSPDDFEVAHVPGSRNIPFATVVDHADELKQYSTVYFYCYGGQGSKATAVKLTGMGLDNVCCVSKGGLSDWQAAGHPVANCE